MNEPQVWTLIGVFAASLFAVMTLMSTMFVRVIRAEISGVRGEISGVRGEIDGLRTEMSLRFEAMEAKFERRFDHLDRDVRAIAKVVFPER
jgi:hypothetical protein